MASAEVSSGTANNQGGDEETRLQELMSRYLEYKLEVFNRRFSSPVDVVVDLNKIEPWDLPSDAKMCDKHQTGVDVSIGDMRTYVSDSTAYSPSPHHDEPDQWVSAHHDGFNMATPKEEEFLHLARGSKPSDDSDVLHNEIPWAAVTKLGIQLVSALASYRGRYSIHHRDLKPGKPSAERRIGIVSLKAHRRKYLSAPDSCRSGHGKMAVNAKTSASWIVATAAPHHATGNRDLLSGFIMEHDGQFVHGVNRVPMKVLARGAVVTDALILPDVWFVPGLKENLVSVSQLAELDHSIGFGRGECCIRSVGDGKIVGKGRLQKGGHYVLDYLKLPLAI